MSQSIKLNLFNRWASTYDWLLPSVFYQAIHQRLLEYIWLPETAHILDLGCGTGKLLNRIAKQYPQITGTGLDFSPEMLQQAQQKTTTPDRLSYVQGATDQLPLRDNQFDAVFCTISFLHYPDPAAVLTEIHRVLKPGGLFYLADYTPSKLSGKNTLLIPTGNLCFYSQIARENLGKQAALLTEAHYYLLGPIMLTIFAKPAEAL
ncbi:MAG: class I SAM-dependent methyltransferase [Cyanobacteria bacterium P01_G01_bin.38]